ncbi:MAG: hypothetical protein ACYS0I_07860 [Planctomycetota bacterium]|jgi:hypothetical protein
MTKFEIKIDIEKYEDLDKLALMACQNDNYGNNGDWFSNFRGGLHGFLARAYGVETHYKVIHSWQYNIRNPKEHEYHVGSLLFNMDSALECFTYALNALGFGVLGEDFIDITNDKKLRGINPQNVIGNKKANPPKNPIAGYQKLYPQLQKYWFEKEDLILSIIDQHDVSKHRTQIINGGRCRLDASEGFYEKISVDDKPELQFLFWPMERIFLRTNPKIAHSNRPAENQTGKISLEYVVEQYAELIKRSLSKAVEDFKKCGS